jgi:AbrB family looped-hinge helix DNA binding protein
MTTNLGQRGQLVIPKAIRTERNLQPGDDFEVIADEDDADLILLRRIRPAANAGLVEHLATCRIEERCQRPPVTLKRCAR